MNLDPILNLALSRIKSSNRAIVGMGYDSLESNIILSMGDGDKFPDPLIIGSYDIVWWNLTDYINPVNDPYVEIVKCIAKYGDTIVVIRSQDGPAYDKNFIGKTYGMAPLNIDNINNINSPISTLSYYNVPQIHGSTLHDGTVETTTGATAKVTAHNVSTGVHDVTGSVAGTAGIQTLSSKTLDNTNIITIKDANFTIQDDVTTTKQAKFQTSGISAVTTRTITLQDADITMESTAGSQAKVDVHAGLTTTHGAIGAIVGTTNTQTLSGKTLTTPTIGDFTNANHTHAAAGITGGVIDHVNLVNKGTNTHAQIDTAIGTTLPSSISTHAALTTGTHGAGANTIENTGNKNAANGYAGLIQVSTALHHFL